MPKRDKSRSYVRSPLSYKQLVHTPQKVGLLRVRQAGPYNESKSRILGGVAVPTHTNGQLARATARVAPTRYDAGF
jgi:hypothetical protein